MPEFVPLTLPGSPVGSVGAAGGSVGAADGSVGAASDGGDMSDLANMLMSDGDDAVSAEGSIVDIENIGGMRAPAAAVVTVSASVPAAPAPAQASAAAARGRGVVTGRVNGARGRGGGGTDEHIANLSRMRAQLVARGRGGFVNGRGGREQKCRGAKRTTYTNLSPDAVVKRRDSGRGSASRGRMGARGGGRGILLTARGRGRGRGPPRSG